MDVPAAIPATTALTSCSRNTESEYGFGMVIDAAGGDLFPSLWPPVSSSSNYSALQVDERQYPQVDERQYLPVDPL